MPIFSANILFTITFYIAPVKLISKKEQKRLEDLEFEKLMAETAAAGSSAAATTAPVEESKKAPETTAEVDEKKRLANLKKK